LSFFATPKADALTFVEKIRKSEKDRDLAGDKEQTGTPLCQAFYLRFIIRRGGREFRFSSRKLFGDTESFNYKKAFSFV